MALGGGVYLTMNKVLPGTYINFVSAANASARLSDRGFAAAGFELNWGKEGEVFEVTNKDFLSDSLKIFGYAYDSEKLKGMRDLFANANTVYFYRLTGGSKAECSFAKAKYAGSRGNDIKIVIAKVEEGYTVTTYIDLEAVDEQNVKNAQELIDNDFVEFKKEALLEENAGILLTGGADTQADAGKHQKFLDALESFSFNILLCLSDEGVLKKLYGDYTKMMRDNHGVKFQTVIHDYAGEYEGIINVGNDAKEDEKYGLVWWVGGAQCACNINESLTNRLYDGEYTPIVDFKQSELEKAVKNGRFMFHRNSESIRVLEDINSFTEFSASKSSDFGSNQVIRLLDNVGNDIAVMFNSYYLGKVQNNKAGRTSFWNDIVSYNRQLEGIGAIENFESEDVVVEIGNDKKTVAVKNSILPVCAMSRLYMTVVVE